MVVRNFLFRFEVADELPDPVFVLNTLPDDNTPEFTFVHGIAEGDTMRLQITASTDTGFASGLNLTNTVDAAEDAAELLDMATGALPDGDYRARMRNERAGVPTAWSNVILHQVTSFHLDALAWVNTVKAAGGTVSGTQHARISNLITALDVGGVWPLLDRLIVFAGEASAPQSLIDVRNPAVVSEITGTPAAFNAFGYTGNPAGNFYIDSKLLTNADFGFGLNDQCMGVYISQHSTAGIILGDFSGYNYSMQIDSRFAIGALRDQAFFDGGSPGTNPVGLFVVTRDAAAVKLYRNGANLIGQTPSTPSGFNNKSIKIFGRDAGVTVDLLGNARTGAVFFGGHLTEPQIAVTYDALQAYMTAWGVAV